MDGTFNYAKINGIKYYLMGNQIVHILNGTPIVQYKFGDAQFGYWRNLILNNNSAKQYYKDAYEFTRWFKQSGLAILKYSNAIDEVIANDGTTSITNVWNGDNRQIFDFNTGTDAKDNIENKTSNFNQHRLDVIRHKIETNLAIAISNYNEYSGVATYNVFQMPELKENEWDNITHNISLISFLQGLHIGGKVYNGYTLVTNSESKEVVLENNIYILGNDGYYHKIGDKGFETGGTLIGASGRYGPSVSSGRLNLDFEKSTLIIDNATYQYYPLDGYKASYDSVIMQNNVTTYDDIYLYVNDQNAGLKRAFYTALGRERTGKYKSNIIY